MLFVTFLAGGLMGCGQTIEKIGGWTSGHDCKFDRVERGQKMCLHKTDYVEAPIYCYKTIGGAECYAQPDRFADNRAPIHPASLPMNTLAARNMPPGTVPGSRDILPELALVNPEGREGAEAAVKREIAAINAKIDAERLAVAVPMAPTLSEPLIEPPKVEDKKAPPKRPAARRAASTGRPTSITTRPARPAGQPGDQPATENARPMTDAEGAAQADRQRQ